MDAAGVLLVDLEDLSDAAVLPVGGIGASVFEFQAVLDDPLVRRFQVGDELVTKRAGEVSFAPRNVPHALANHSDANARYVLVCTPPGLERQFARIAAASRGVEPPDWALQPGPAVIEVGPRIARDREAATGRPAP